MFRYRAKPRKAALSLCKPARAQTIELAKDAQGAKHIQITAYQQL